jgi:SAM-dependent methyltransferase
MDIDNQFAYWDSVAKQKTFTHPIDLGLLNLFVNKGSSIVDFGCGYGRSVKELIEAGYKNIIGFDTSTKLIERGRSVSLPLEHIENPEDLPLADDSVDCFLLLAVLTCIPTNNGQQKLIDLLHQKLRPGGVIYISDYYLQSNTDRYTYYNEDRNNYGVFTLPEGTILRHHTKDWIRILVRKLVIKSEKIIQTKTMNGNPAEIFQIICRRETAGD